MGKSVTLETVHIQDKLYIITPWKSGQLLLTPAIPPTDRRLSLTEYTIEELMGEITERLTEHQELADENIEVLSWSKLKKEVRGW